MSTYSQVPHKRVYSIIIFLTRMHLIRTFIFLLLPYSTSKFSTPLVYLCLLIYEICSKYPPYSFIRPYSFNWHLRVVQFTGLFGFFSATRAKARASRNPFYCFTLLSIFRSFSLLSVSLEALFSGLLCNVLFNESILFLKVLNHLACLQI